MNAGVDETLLRGVLLIVLCLSSVIAWRYWQAAVFGLFFWDAIRDPLRKILPGEQLSLVCFGLVLWLVTLVSCLKGRSWTSVHLRGLWGPLAGLLIFLCCGVYSAIRNEVPVTILLLGLTSFLFPIVGYPIGDRLARDTRLIADLLVFYCILNVLFAATAVLEVAGMQSPLIGGIQMEWYRVTGATSIPLPSGLYRSPDILGLHAAHALAFSVLLWRCDLSMFRKGLMMIVGLVAAVLLLYSARRKMQGLFLAFFSIWLFLSIIAPGVNGRMFLNSRVRKSLLVQVSGITLFFALVMRIFPAHLQYAGSILFETPERVVQSLIESPLTTIRQSGFWGTGLGTATQGNSILSAGFQGGWQEDGFGRLFREGGVPGALAAIFGGLWFVITRTATTIRSVTDTGLSERFPYHGGIWALVLANFCCLAISHQHFSGDPQFGAFLALMVGLSDTRPTQDAHE